MQLALEMSWTALACCKCSSDSVTGERLAAVRAADLNKEFPLKAKYFPHVTVAQAGCEGYGFRPREGLADDVEPSVVAAMWVKIAVDMASGHNGRPTNLFV